MAKAGFLVELTPLEKAKVEERIKKQLEREAMAKAKAEAKAEEQKKKQLEREARAKAETEAKAEEQKKKQLQREARAKAKAEEQKKTGWSGNQERPN